MKIRKESELLNAFRKYKRKEIMLLDNSHDLDLMAIDFVNEIHHQSRNNIKSEIKLLCLDNRQGTYQVTVKNFATYFYVQAPAFAKEEKIPQILESLKQRLNLNFGKGLVTKVEIMKKESLMSFKGRDEAEENHLKIYLSDYTMMSRLASYFKKSFTVDQVQFCSEPYESNVSFLMRFLVDKKIGGMSWINIPHGKYKLSRNQGDNFCHNQIVVDAKDIKGHDIQDEQWSSIANLRMMSFDIECSSHGKFPEPNKNPIITIGIACKIHSKIEMDHKVVLQLGDCEDIYDCDLFTFESEEMLISAFDYFLSTYDPDVIMGYNILNFDMRYLLERRKQFPMLDYVNWSRREGHTVCKVGKLNSKIMGFRETYEYNIFGRMVLDLYIHMMKEKKLSSYKLNSVSYEFLNEQKEEVHHSMISVLQEGTDKDRKRLASYCLKDAILPMKLCDKLKCVFNYVEMARVTGVPISFLFNRGQQIKVKSQILRHINGTKLIMPISRSQANPDGVGYQGADVLQPKSAFYRVPIATLDFASLYPSIMISHNFCYSTLCQFQDIKHLKEGEDYFKTPNGCYFIRKKHREGILPKILHNLLSARKKAKKDLFAAKQQLQSLKEIEVKNHEIQQKILKFKNLVGVLDGRQLALKISANSVYGFTGASRGSLPCLEIASSTTSIGRQMIEKTKNYIMGHYNIKNGYKYDSDVIYGDTDSVMINFGTKDIKRAMELGKEAADLLSERFMKPIKLEFEKVYYPYLLITKKRYAGLLWTNPESPDKKDCKGVESVRRDSCQLVRKMVDKILEIILYEQNFDKAIDYCKGKIYDLLNNRIDISELIISKSLSKELYGPNGYNSNLAHVALARRLVKTKNLQFNVGDRIPFVIISKTKKAKQYEKSEDPIIAFENNIPLDYNYYLNNQIKPPLERIFSFYGHQEIFEGNHTRFSKKQNISSTKGIGMFFTAKKKQCISCKKILKDSWSKPTCENCQKKEKELYLNQVLKLKSKEKQYNKLWSECQRCEESLLTEVICSNTHCSIFFKRKTLQKEIQKSYQKLKSFNY